MVPVGRERGRPIFTPSRFLTASAVHHRIPVAAGGLTELRNLETRCAECHLAVHRGAS